MFLNNQWVDEEIKKEIGKFLEANDNGNPTYQNLWDTILEAGTSKNNVPTDSVSNEGGCLIEPSPLSSHGGKGKLSP